MVTLPGAGEGAGQVIEVVPGLTGALQRLMWSLAETLGNTPGSTRDWWWWGHLMRSEYTHGGVWGVAIHTLPRHTTSPTHLGWLTRHVSGL